MEKKQRGRGATIYCEPKQTGRTYIRRTIRKTTTVWRRVGTDG
jgi:hypothetical protein